MWGWGGVGRLLGVGERGRRRLGGWLVSVGGRVREWVGERWVGGQAGRREDKRADGRASGRTGGREVERGDRRAGKPPPSPSVCLETTGTERALFCMAAEGEKVASPPSSPLPSPPPHLTPPHAEQSHLNMHSLT